MTRTISRARSILTGALALSVLAGGCISTEVEGEEEVPYDPADEEAPPPFEPQAVVLTAPIVQRAGAWWGDVSKPLVDQVWGEVINATPGKNLTSPFTFQWKCQLPVFPGNEQTLKLTSTSFSINSDVKQSWSNPAQNQLYSFTLDPAKYSSGWVEIRIRCKGTETVGVETGEVTAITIGFPLQLRGGTSSSQNHSGTNYVDTHGWYDRGVDYVYATILNVSDLVGQPLSGTVALKLKARTSGDTTLDHFMVKIDGVIARQASNNVPAEFFGTTGDRTIYIDTRQLSNGPHVLAMHSHGLERSGSEQPGRQLASQSEVTINVQN